MGITTITLCAFAVLAAWAILRTLGAERQRRMRELIAAHRPPPPAPAPPEPPHSQLLPPKSVRRKAA